MKYYIIVITIFLLISLSVIIIDKKTHNYPEKTFKIPLESITYKGIPIKQLPSIPSLNGINQIFSLDHSWTATLSAEKKVTLIATGDVGMGRTVNTRTIKYQDWKWAWQKTADILRKANITLINLEAPLISDCKPTDEGMIFCADARHIEGLKFAGVDIASTANNHYGNYRLEGVKESNDLLLLNDIIYTNNSKIPNITRSDASFIFLNYNEIGYKEDGLDWAEDEKIKKEVQDVNTAADVVVVSFHWGVEYTTDITQRQKELAHLAIDSGADLIIGNHAHWIQPLEFYKGKLIMYAHGNFIFDQMWSQETREGVVGKYTFYDKKLVDVEFLPVQIDDFGQPHFVEGTQKQRILNNLKKISLSINN